MSLIEKGFAKLYGTYEAIEGGFVDQVCIETGRSPRAAVAELYLIVFVKISPIFSFSDRTILGRV